MSKPHSGQLIRSNALTRRRLILMVAISLRPIGEHITVPAGAIPCSLIIRQR